MAARIVRVIMYPWDAATFPTVDPPYGGVRTAAFSEPAPEVFTNGGAFRIDKFTAMGMYPRVRGWKLQSVGNISINAGTSTPRIEGPILLSLPAVDFTDTPLTSEEDVSKCAGWFKEDTAPAMWTYYPVDGDPADYDISYISFRFGERTGTPDDQTTFKPTIVLSVNFGPGPVDILVGKGNIDDDCLSSSEFPITSEGSFDRYGETRTFNFQLGAYPGLLTPSHVISGTLTFTPDVWWAYDTMDGDGPVFNTATGEWLRTPPKSRWDT